MVDIATHHGTVIAVVRGSDFIVASSDSRTTDDENQTRDSRDKIIELDEHAFFALAGMNILGGISILDHTKRGYLAAQFLPLEEHVRRWTEAMGQLFYGLPMQLKKQIILQLSGIGSSTFMVGIFGKIVERSPKVIFSQIMISEQIKQISVDAKIGEIPVDRPMVFAAIGTTVKTVNSLLEGNGPSEREWHSDVLARAAELGFGGARRTAFLCQEALYKVIGDGTDPTIGGKVKTIIVERDHPLVWFVT